MDEFSLIHEVFAPLAAGAPGAFGLKDDAAVITPAAGEDLVVTADAVVEGVHFLTEDPLDLVARKALRVNLSDLAAKGARPIAYLLTLGWPRGRPLEDARAFGDGLAGDQDAFAVTLIGGDTVATPGPLTASITAIGAVPQGSMVRRDGARPGDSVFVTGSIGDAALGLRALRGELSGLDEVALTGLAQRYRLPQPRVEAAQRVRETASASIDVSDGLAADAGHVARASEVMLSLELERLPLSPSARAWLAAQPDRGAALAALAAGGDDYEILVCAPAALDAQGEAFTRIGEVSEGEGVRLVDGAGRIVEPPRSGFTHF